MVINSKLILLRPHSVVAHSRYKSSRIKPGQISLAGRQPRVREKSDSPLVTLRPKPNKQQLPMRHCSRFPLKPTSWFQTANDAGIQPAADDARHCQPLSLKALFRATQKVYPNTSWDGTMQQTRLPASQSNSPFQVLFRESNLIPSETAPAATSLHRRHFSAVATTTPAPATTSLQKQQPLLHR